MTIPMSTATTDRTMTIATMARCNSKSTEFLRTVQDSAGFSGGISALCVTNTQLDIAENLHAFIVAIFFPRAPIPVRNHYTEMSIRKHVN